MNKVSINGELLSVLNDLDQQTEVRDEDGKLIGMYLPIWAYEILEACRKQVYATTEVPYSQDELQKMRQETGGASLQDFWNNFLPVSGAT